MPFQLLDIILVAIMLVSGLLALLRGFTREVLSLVAWGLAALAAYFASKQEGALAFAQTYLEKPLLAQIAVAAVAFIIVLIIVSIISVKLSDAVIDSAAGAFDRTLGFIFGIARGLVLVSIAYLFYSWLVPADRQDEWVKNAQALPLIKSTGDLLVTLMPPDIAETLSNASLIQNPETPPPPATLNDQQGGISGEDLQNLGNIAKDALNAKPAQ